MPFILYIQEEKKLGSIPTSSSVRDLTRHFEEGMAPSASTVSLSSVQSQSKKKHFKTGPKESTSAGISIDRHISAVDPLNTDDTPQSETSHEPSSSAPSKDTDTSGDTEAPKSSATSSTPSKDDDGDSKDPSSLGPSPIGRLRTGKSLVMSQEHSPYETSDSSSICQGQNISRSLPIVPPPPQVPIGRMINNVEMFMDIFEWAEGGLLRVREGNKLMNFIN